MALKASKRLDTVVLKVAGTLLAGGNSAPRPIGAHPRLAPDP